jgi:hypothetical protein
VIQRLAGAAGDERELAQDEGRWSPL